MDEQNYNNRNNSCGDLIDKPENYPSEKEIISSQNIDNNNTDNIPQNNYCPPPIPLEVNQPNQPQAPYLKYGAIYNPNYLNPVPPPIPVENDISYQPDDNNKNVVLIPVQQQIVEQNDENKDKQTFDQIQQKENEKKEQCCSCCNEDCVQCILGFLYIFYCICLIFAAFGGAN